MWHDVFTASAQNFCGMSLLSSITITIPGSPGSSFQQPHSVVESLGLRIPS